MQRNCQFFVAALWGLLSCVASGSAFAADLALGAKVFAADCAKCHASARPDAPPAAGAPQLADKAEWKDRYGKGRNDLYKSALDGFTGYYEMPARGGNKSLGDAEVKAAVDYMLDQALK